MLDPVRQWLASVVDGAQVATTKGGGAHGVFQLQILGLKSRGDALRVASQVLAAYGRARHGRGSAALGDRQSSTADDSA